MSASSRGMIWTGLLLGLFLVIHVAHMKYGAFVSPEVYDRVVPVGGASAHDLYARVVDAFRQPVWVVFYAGSMVVLGMLSRMTPEGHASASHKGQ